MRRVGWTVHGVLWGGLFALAGCGSPVSSGDPEPRTVTVLAASSLTEVTAAWAEAFERSHPAVRVVRSHAGSQTLATQIRHGYPADVFASADVAHMSALADEHLVGDPQPLAANVLVLAVRDSISPVPTLRDLASRDLSLVVGGPEVPLGRYTDTLLDGAVARYGDAWRTAVESHIVSREPNARLVVAKVGLGEADAAIAYRTDVSGVDGVRSVELDGLSPTTRYVDAVLTDASEPELATDWRTFVRSEEGSRVLKEHGFSPP